MNRRHLLQKLAAVSALANVPGVPTVPTRLAGARVQSRLRSGDPAWPSQESWQQLHHQVGGRLLAVEPPFTACLQDPTSADCEHLLRSLKNPYFLRDAAALTQTLGWVDAWTSRPSVFAVAARSASDVMAAVNFAREHNVRVAVKGAGHSYQGTSNAADSLLIWTRGMEAITLHDAFVAAGCAEASEPQQAVTIEAGAIWGKVYDAVTSKAGRYVQGGGCLTVGVAGLIQSGGFGSFSKAYGTAAASLLEAEVVTADGALKRANACTNPDLFWALKGGGGGSLGVVTRVTLRTHALPSYFGASNVTIKAKSDAAFRRLIARMIGFYRDRLFNPNWGEQIGLRPDNVLAVAMVQQGLSQAQAEATWRPFLADVGAAADDFAFVFEPRILTVPARDFWNPSVLGSIPGLVLGDARPGAGAGDIYYATNAGEAGQVLHAYRSLWLPASLLEADQQQRLADRLFAASRHWPITLHTNKGLAGAAADVLAASKNTATNPAVLDAFALLISAAHEGPAYPGVRGHEPAVATARRHAEAVKRAVDEVAGLSPQAGCYVAESDYFDQAWQQSFWGSNYPQLLNVKDKYDPDGLFIVHHGVGSERWSADGFSRLTR